MTDHLPERERPWVRRKLRGAWEDPDQRAALATLEALARQLEVAHPAGAASLREGLAETLTVTRLGLRGRLKARLASTNPCESMVRHEAPCEGRARTRRSSSVPAAMPALGRCSGLAKLGAVAARDRASWWEQPRRRSGRAVLPDARVRASKTERQSESEAVVEAS